jgi:hypothetical protein
VNIIGQLQQIGINLYEHVFKAALKKMPLRKWRDAFFFKKIDPCFVGRNMRANFFDTRKILMKQFEYDFSRKV